MSSLENAKIDPPLMDPPLTPAEDEEFSALAKQLAPLPDKAVFVPPPITGYRNLTQAEVDLMNKVKAVGVEMGQLFAEVRGHLSAQRYVAANAQNITELDRIDRVEPSRWLAIGKTHLQEGLMAVTRAVAQPSTF